MEEQMNQAYKIILLDKQLTCYLAQRTPTSLLQPKRCVVVPNFSFGLQHNTNTCFACIVINNTKVTLFEYTHKESSSDYPELRRTCTVAKGGAILKSYETN